MARQGLILAVAAGSLVASERNGLKKLGELEPLYESPRLRQLATDLRSENNKAFAAFCSEMTGKAPLIEPIENDSENLWFTYLWLGDESTREVVIYGDIPSKEKVTPRRLENTQLWFRTARVPKDARFGYAFQINRGKIQLDPWNPRHLAGRSIAALPDAPSEPWISNRPDVPKGQVTRHIVTDITRGEERAFAVYTPPGENSQHTPFGLLIVFDGESYGYSEDSAIPTPRILDNLLAAKKIKPMVAMFLNSQKTRDRDLVCSEEFADFVARQLVPWAQQRYNVSKQPSDVILAGSSYGGLCAAFLALRFPQVFGNVLSQSGSFRYFPGSRQNVLPNTEETGWLIREFVKAPNLKTRFCIQVGKLETAMIADHRRLRDVLEAKGCFVSYSEVFGSHDYVNWRSSFPDGLIALAGFTRATERPD